MDLVDWIRPKVKSMVKGTHRFRREFSRHCQMSPHAFMQQNLFEKIVFIAISCVDNNSLSSVAVIVSSRRMRRRIFAQCHSNNIYKKKKTKNEQVNAVKSHWEQTQAAAATIHPQTILFSIVSHFFGWHVPAPVICELPMCAFAVIFDSGIVEHFSARLNGLKFVEHYHPNTHTYSPSPQYNNKPVAFFCFTRASFVRIKSKWNANNINWKFNQNEAFASRK